MKGVIFDLDGVIVSTDLFHFRAWQAIAEKYKLIFSEEINHLLRGVSRTESLKILLNLNGRQVLSDVFEEMLAEKNACYKASLNALTGADLLPGVQAFLTDLRAQDIGIAIGSSSKNAELILRQIGLAGYFDVVVDGNGISNSKPHPEVFLKAASALHLKPADCIVFEDAAAGVEAALSAGMRVVGVGNAGLQAATVQLESLKDMTVQKLFKLLN